MRHSLYCNHMPIYSGSKKCATLSRDRPDKKGFSKKGKNNNFFPSLEGRINEVLALYKDSPSIHAKIIEKLETYRLNVAIARDVKSSKSEEKLTKEFLKYIKNLKIKNRKD